ncbi:transcriptional regulator [Caloranaerobacter azorensis H53214]|uniref:DNA-binding response regulator, OmpR family, contains REC and winged-helix (WHTH) domain n=2 Tax=Caloranaerobacter azorensis TaxID=116090 RepID=A0A1M5RGJ4_9FIRM|nr:response regulator transcription factor [Caloranaerobacter azorensis]KGG80717.1 transcriptional regulator [Caloranaerobacter azorensis H53214]SHH25425.1 DNA-binding response regulator, OmpR family, contains REC and winged-helix (wHTH) domain [Caloranaerobacter azorensis DSM 13643]
MPHIFVVDDEKNIRDLIKKYLQKEGYRVTLFEEGTNLLKEIDRLKPDLIVLDIMMPGIDGLELCKEIRKNNDIPIIFVSAKDEEVDRIVGLELGGDDYLSKPFSPRELVVRIKNILRRIEKAKNINETIIEIKDVKIHTERRFVEINGKELKLTTKEYDLFEYLAKNKNRPFTRDELIDKIWGYDYIPDNRMIDDLVKRIRKKLKEMNSELGIITVWGYGYRMDG